MDNELKDSIIKFLEAFEQVFDKDWDYTKEQLGVVKETEDQKQNSINALLQTIHFISPDGTFINPKVKDEVNNWGHRPKLLIEYRKLIKLLSKN